MNGLPYKWVVAIVVIFGIFMSILDTTIVNIAIPRLQTAFGASLADVQWVSTGYTLAQGVATPLTPFFSGRLGLKRFYLIVLALFTIGSALCGLAWSLPVLIFCRLLQGVGGACLLPMSITLLYREFPPEERGTALGVLGVPILLAPALGPTVGGYIVTYFGWQLIFYINVPIGIFGLIMGIIFLRESPANRNVHFDLPGFLLSAAGLASLLYGLSDVSTDGWGSVKVLSYIIGGLIALTVFIIVELEIVGRGGEPLLDLRLFKNQPFATGNIAYVMVTFALFGGLFLVPVYLQNLRGQDAFQAGLLLLPQALGSMAAVVIGGRLVDRIGVKAVVIPGLILLALALWGFSFTTLQTPFMNFQVLLILRGFGLGLSAQPLTVAILAEIKPIQLSQGTTINSVIRNVASSLGVAVLSTLVQTRSTFHYVRLAEQVTLTTPLGQRLSAALAAPGGSSSPSTALLLQEVVGQLKLQAYMLAINDAFLFTLGVTVLALFTVFVIRVKSKPRAVVSQEDATSEESAPLALMEM
jgi:EmrB/QacA subfamily drug resistance transporter